MFAWSLIPSWRCCMYIIALIYGFLFFLFSLWEFSRVLFMLIKEQRKCTNIFVDSRPYCGIFMCVEIFRYLLLDCENNSPSLISAKAAFSETRMSVKNVLDWKYQYILLFFSLSVRMSVISLDSNFLAFDLSMASHRYTASSSN